MKIEGKFIFKVAGTLTAISLVVALLLGLTNMLTADKSAAINKQKTEAALAKVVSAADCEFPPMEDIAETTLTSTEISARKPKRMTLMMSAGHSAMITSSMIERVSSLLRIWGLEEAMSFRPL